MYSASLDSSITATRIATRPWHWWLAWGSFGLTLLLLLPTVVLVTINRQAPDIWAIAEPEGMAGSVLAGLVGGLLATRRARNAIGWLLLLIALFGQLADLSEQWGVYALVTHTGARGGAYGLWAG